MDKSRGFPPKIFHGVPCTNLDEGDGLKRWIKALATRYHKIDMAIVAIGMNILLSWNFLFLKDTTIFSRIDQASIRPSTKNGIEEVSLVKKHKSKNKKYLVHFCLVK